MASNFVFNFQQFVQYQAIFQGHPFFPSQVLVAFDEDYYLTENPDIAIAMDLGIVASGLVHFLRTGIEENRRPSAFFSENLYLKVNPDVALAVQQGILKSGLQHFFLNGLNEGRDGLGITYEIGGLRIAMLFDEAYYQNQNLDIKEAIKNNLFTYGFEHFAVAGIYEGRNPSDYYNEALYRQLNPDVEAAIVSGFLKSGLEHYLTTGHREGRLASLLFNPLTYLADNPDVADAIAAGLIGSAFEHYIEHGAQEGRVSTQLYEEAFYLANNPDIVAAIAQGLLPSGLAHFLTTGVLEGRRPSELYDEESYLAANPEVSEAIEQGLYKTGLEHYLKVGMLAGNPLTPTDAPTLDFSQSSQAVQVILNDNQVNFLNFGANFKLMATGDSITQGVGEGANGAATPEAQREGYRLDLWQQLQNGSFPVDFVGPFANGPDNLPEKEHLGIRGIRIWEVNDRIGGDLNTYAPDVMLLMLGTNNDTPQSDLPENEDIQVANNMLAQYSTLLDTILNNSTFTGHVLVGTIAPARTDSAWKVRNDQFKLFNAGLVDLINAKNNSDRLTLIQVGTLLNDSDMSSLTVDNGLHPNQGGYAKMATAWYDALTDLVIASSTTTAGEQNVIGSGLDDILIGDNRVNRITGGAGEDVLTGGGGSDVFVLNAVSEGGDTITDWSTDDRLELLDAGFPGNLAGGFDLVAAASPTVASNRPTFLYNTGTGLLSYDSDGQGGQGIVQLLTLKGAPTLTTEQITVV
jgi:lysophospholipase L1-like esterase